MLSVTQTTDDIVIVDAAGKLTAEDYRQFDRELAAVAERDRNLRVLVRMTDLHGWEPKALWEDVQLEVAYEDVLDRMALVGDRRWQEWMARFSQPFTDVDIRYFDESEAPGAVGWLLERR